MDYTAMLLHFDESVTRTDSPAIALGSIPIVV